LPRPAPRLLASRRRGQIKVVATQKWAGRIVTAAALTIGMACEREAPTPAPTPSPPPTETRSTDRKTRNPDAAPSPSEIARGLLEVEVLPSGRVRLPDGRVMADDAFITALADDEMVVRERSAGREVMVLLKPAGGAGLERTHSLIERIKIPGVLTGSPIP
jgi:hypothetical protein